MAKVYTKTGDRGETALVGGERIGKDHEKIEAYGTVDELNSWIGVLSDANENESRRPVLKEIQDRLFTIGAELASSPDYNRNKLPELFESDIEFLEKEIDKYSEDLEPLKAFILPGGHQLVSFAHVARTTARRAERAAIRLSRTEEVNPLIIKYLNRLSDYLFVLGRKISQEQNAPEIVWQPRINKP